MNLSWILWERMLRDQQPVLLFCRTFSPVAHALVHISGRFVILPEEFLYSDTKQRLFTSLTGLAGKLCGAQSASATSAKPGVFLSIFSMRIPRFASRCAIENWKDRMR